MSHREPNIVVVGYGRWGRECHSYLVRTTPGLRLHGVVSGDPDKRAAAERDQGCRSYATPTEAFTDDAVDAVVLATPNDTHHDLSIAALRAGKHVVTDKIMCLSLAECDAMLAAARAAGRHLSVFQNRRFDGDFLTVRQLVAAGDLGDLRWVEMAWQGMGPWGGWRGSATKGGGRFLDLGAHLVDQLLQLFPAPVESVYCRQRRDFPSTDVDSEALLIVTFAGGGTGIVDTSSLAAISKPRFYVRGTRATFEKHGLDPQEAAMKQGDIDAAREDESLFGRLKGKDAAGAAVDRRVPTVPGRWRTYYENWRDVLLGTAEPVVKPNEMRRAMAVFDAALRSATTGEAVRLAL